MKKVLLVDDSALMRRVLCDIIDSDERFHVADRATNGEEALELLKRKEYDVVILDVNMPKMNGLELLRALKLNRIKTRVVMASTDTKEGAKTTLDALSLGAIDFIHKPSNPIECKNGVFNTKLIRIISTVCDCKETVFEEENQEAKVASAETVHKLVELARKANKTSNVKQIVAIASSTGGPRALQEVIPKLPASLNAPVVLVQHMPAGFTKTLAERLDDLSDIKVSEAVDGETLECGHVYIARGGKHMNVDSVAGKFKIRYSDEPTREGVKPSANYMYESLGEGIAQKVVCVVLTGMGADGTAGIRNLKKTKNTYVITQNEASCTVYGMPKSTVNAGLSDLTVPLDTVAQEIIMNVGVN